MSAEVPSSSSIPSPTSRPKAKKSSRRDNAERRDSSGSKKDSGRSDRRARGGLGRRYKGFSRWFLQAKHWFEQQTTVVATKAALLRIVDRFSPILCRILDRTVVRSWPAVVVVGRVMLVLSLLVLSCYVRGLKSIFRLTTAASLLILWCSISNLMLLSGVLYVLFPLGISAAAAIFIGYTPAFAVVCISGALLLWMYGSFWTTSAVILFGAFLFYYEQTKTSIFIGVIYSLYSLWIYGGWLGFMTCITLACVSNDGILHLVKHLERRRSHSYTSNTYTTDASPSSSSPTATATTSSSASSSQETDGDQTSAEEEVTRVLSCIHHYAVVGFTKFEIFDEAVLKREYRKKAMLVHPDKNRGNGKAEEAFKRLQNAYEVLSDSVKRKNYDDDLRREDLLTSLRRDIYKNGRSEEGIEIEVVNGRPVVCRNCTQTHIWIPMDRTKQQARWCQECGEYHPAKNGDGWVEQSGYSFLFGLIQKVGSPESYACAGDIVYLVTEWASCQGMRCPANTHKPSFFVSSSGGSGSGGRGFDVNNMSDEEFCEWLRMAAGIFNEQQQQQQQPSNSSKRRKKKGKK